MSAPADLDSIDPRLRYARPEVRAAEKMLAAMKAQQHVTAYNGFEMESEVIPSGPVDESASHQYPDTRPLSATGADRLNPFAEIATLLRSLTWREMMDLSEAWNTPAKTLHDWAAKR